VKIADGFILFFSAKGLEKDDVENAVGVNAQRLPAYGGLHRPRNTIA
jgi:hypothetical protein